VTEFSKEKQFRSGDSRKGVYRGGGRQLGKKVRVRARQNAKRGETADELTRGVWFYLL